MPYSTTAEQFDPSNPRFTADRFTLRAQMRSEAPVTFLPALNVYAVRRWQEVHDVLGDAMTAIAAAVTFLVSDDASDITDSTLAVDDDRL